MHKLKVLIIMQGFFPAQTYGGPPVSINNLCNLLGSEIIFFIVCSNHELNSSLKIEGILDGWNEHKNYSVLYLSDNESSISKYIKIIKEISPDLIYLNSLFSKEIYKILIISRILSLPLLIAPRGELCINAYDKKWKKIPYLFILSRLFRSKRSWYQSTSSEETKELMRKLRIKHDRIFELTNIPSISNNEIHKSVKNIGSCRLVFISRIQTKKNLLFALSILKQIKHKVSFDIYGPLENNDYWEKCKNVINQLPDNITVKYQGVLNHFEVGRTFQMYDAFLFPTLSENYGHVIVEAMLNKCPVITSDQIPWTDIRTEHAGWSISLNNRQEFINAIESLCEMNQNDYDCLVEKCTKYINYKLNFDLISNSYIKSFNTIVQENYR